MSVRVRYVYSACVVIETADVRILCDPWISEGVYDGSWYHFPSLADDVLERIGEVDLVWVSHIHPDHYDPAFLRSYLARYPDTRVMVADFEKNFLSRKMTADGIPHDVRSRVTAGGTEIEDMPNE